MYRCIANLEIDLEGLSEFYSDVSEYETLNMYQIISAWLIILKVLIIYMRDFYKPWRIIRRLNLSMSHYL